MNIESELQNALRRKAPAPGFASRVLDRIEGNATPRVHRVATWRAVAASLLLVAVLGGWGGHALLERRRAAEGERARQQVLLAMHITSAKLAEAQRQVRELSAHEPQSR